MAEGAVFALQRGGGPGSGLYLAGEGLGLDQIDARATSKLRSGLPRFGKGIPS